MRRSVKILLGVSAAVIVLILIGPLLVPVQKLDTVPARELAYPDSTFVTLPVRGVDVDVHVRDMGQGETTFLLIHGFASSTYTWHEVMAELAQYGRVVAFDWMPYGLTERPLPPEWRGGQSPYSREAQVELTLALMDALAIDAAILVGNSAGGALAAAVAVEQPERVESLILVAPALSVPDGTGDGGGGGGLFGLLSSPLAQALGTTPQLRRLGPLLVRNIQEWGIEFGKSAWHDPNQLTDEDWDNYLLPVKVDHWDVGLYEAVIAGSEIADPSNSLRDLSIPTLVVTGDDDRIVPTANTVQLADWLTATELVIFEACGHAPQEECPDQFMEAVRAFLQTTKTIAPL